MNRGKLGSLIYVSASVSNGYETIDGRLWQMALVHPSEPEYDGNGKCQSGGQSGMN